MKTVVSKFFSKARFFNAAFFAALFAASFLTAFTAGTASAFAADITVSIPPQKYFVEKIVGKTKSVESLLSDTDNPEIYQVSARQLQTLEQSEIFLTIGVPYEARLLQSLKDRKSKVFTADMGALVKKRPYDEGDDDHGDEAEEDVHGFFDPHIWLSAANGANIAKRTYEVLASQYPKNAAAYKTAYEALLTEIASVKRTVDEMMAPHKGGTILIYHPALGYFADEYGLTQRAIQWKGRESSARQIRNISEDAIQYGVKTVFIQRGFPEQAARSIAERIGGSVAYINPLRAQWNESILTIAKDIAASF